MQRAKRIIRIVLSVQFVIKVSTVFRLLLIFIWTCIVSNVFMKNLLHVVRLVIEQFYRRTVMSKPFALLLLIEIIIWIVIDAK